MFTGIIETLGTVSHLQQEADNLHIKVASPLSDELKIDQSVSHNGVCLTVVALSPGEHTVTAIAETLQKSNLSELQIGSRINLERYSRVVYRREGHSVQGKVDQKAQFISNTDQQSSWLYTIQFDRSQYNNTVEKGSITVNDISLTVVDSQDDRFSIATIPYTHEH